MLDKKSLSMEWRWALYISERIAGMPTDGFDHRYRDFLKIAGMDRRAKPFVISHEPLPAELSNWTDEFVDLNFEEIQDPVTREKAELAFSGERGAVALHVGGKWFAIKNQGFPKDISADYRVIIVMEVDDAQAQKMVRLPDGWDKKVSVGSR